MQILLREERFRANIMDLNRRGYSDFLFVQIGNRRGFIVSHRVDVLSILSEKNMFLATLEEKEKVPLYKQDMQLRMGKRPEQYKISHRSYTVRVLEKCRDNYSYTVWCVV